ncbi:hypothetical protein PAMC26577_32200 [Caballeronia sordidicola]|uniref:Uncharacterized protein n=1 Tax=Caballeronia sordidicola TaxID=196367 RepID=A0A242MCI6_CABSO|nr:hypothetical protein PAMC26577_32200 [Caballeronia sordidicola]
MVNPLLWLKSQRFSKAYARLVLAGRFLKADRHSNQQADGAHVDR